MGLDLSRASAAEPVRVGRYDVVGFIDRGGMGSVYEAVDREHGTRVALKTLDLGQNELRRFKSEFRSVADLDHPNLVQVYELGCEGERWFFTMERVDGVDFVEHLRGPSVRDAATLASAPDHDAPTRPGGAFVAPPSAPPSLPTPPTHVPAIRAALAQLVRGVRALHAAGLLHLDLKPSNVLVDRQGRVVVLDFGLARPKALLGDGPSDEAGISISGTPAWMAPEQFGTEEVGEAADWYAVGLMLYRVLTGMPAFPPASFPVMWYAKLNLPPVPPDQVTSGVPADLSALATALLHPDPSRRPSGETLAAFVSDDEGERARAQSVLARSALVGREREQALVRASVERARSGGSAVLQVVGTSGVGKTALLAELRTLVAEVEGALVLSGRCYERESVPYKAFDPMLDALAARWARATDEAIESLLPERVDLLARAFPVLGRVPAIAARVEQAPAPPTSAIEVRRRTVEALADLFARLASHALLVLEVDDLQWTDADSIAVLIELSAAAAPGLLVAISMRPAEASMLTALAPYLDALRARSEDVTAIDLAPLEPAAAEALARHALASVSPGLAALAPAIARESGGVPFFVEELALHAAEGATGAGERRATTLERLLERRVAALPQAERDLVEVLAVAGSPIPLSVAFGVAGVTRGSLRALWALRRGHFVRSTGARPSDLIELHHDRMRESVLRALDAPRTAERHLGLARALAAYDPGEGDWIFDAAHHFARVDDRLAGSERTRVAELQLEAGRRARRAAAFPLALECFRAGARLVRRTEHALSIALYSAAAEAAYLSGAWSEVDAYVALVKLRGRDVREQRVAREVEIDALISRTEYGEAIASAVETLGLLGVSLPADPTPDEVGAEVQATMAALARLGPEGVARLPLMQDETSQAILGIESRITSAAYFARPLLLPVLACRQVAISVEHGLAPATPYALAVYGIVLDTIGMLPEAHTWGQVALGLLSRTGDDGFDARTRHVVHNLVCCWTVPLASTLDPLRAVVDIGRRTGDLEYAGYAAHAWVHQALYAGRPLEPLLEEAISLGGFLRAHRLGNALHVHTPFEQVLRALTGRAADPARLDGDGFSEAAALEAAREVGSRSAQCLVRIAMGMMRYLHGAPSDASAVLEEARPFLDGMASVWHVPIFHQYAALAIHALPKGEALRARADADLEALRALAVHGPANFAHRVLLVEGARAAADGAHDTALSLLRRAAEGAHAEGFVCDEAIAHELAAASLRARGEDDRPALDAARTLYAGWGAKTKAAQLAR